MFSYKIMFVFAWVGLFILPANTANYEHKKLEFTCKEYQLQVSPTSLVQVKGAISLKTTKFDEDFGGFSGILLSPDQKYLYLLTDRARLLRSTISWEKKQISCLTQGVLRPIRGQSTRALVGHFSDSEGLSFSEKKNHLLISFERNARVVDYNFNSKKMLPLTEYNAFPKDDIGYNLGYETVRYLKNGDILAVPEYHPDSKTGSYPIYRLNHRSQTIDTFWFQPYDDHYVTDISILSNGDFLVLERYFSIFSGFSVQIRHLKQADLWKAISPQKPAIPKIIMQTNSEQGADNFEGMTVRSGGKKGDYLYLVSDDNFTPLQKTVIASVFYPY